jgi:hypothetical protein
MEFILNIFMFEKYKNTFSYLMKFEVNQLLRLVKPILEFLNINNQSQVHVHHYYKQG